MIGFVVFGLVVGALARLLVPGRQHLGILTTLVLGFVGSVAGVWSPTRWAPVTSSR